jgi:hypothetical protein
VKWNATGRREEEESNGTRPDGERRVEEVMVCVGADDKYRGGGVGHEPHVHSLESDVQPTGDHAEMRIGGDQDGVVGVPCGDVGTIVEETGTKEVGKGGK